MFRTLLKALAAIAVVCTAGGIGLIGYEEFNKRESDGTRSESSLGDPFTGTKRIRVDGRSVNVSCAGDASRSGPLVLLMAGGGDGLETMAPIGRTLSKKSRVCSYDRLGEGASDRPDGPQSIDDSSGILTSVLDRLAGDRPVVLAGHSLGGHIAARYAPGHPDRIKGLVLMDATIPTLTADISRTIPASATGMPAQLRAQAIAVNKGENPEKLVIADGDVRPAGEIPVEILQHASQYAEVPEYGPALERMWSAGQEKWRQLSGASRLSTAAGSGHYLHVDRPDLAVGAIQRVAARATSND